MVKEKLIQNINFNKKNFVNQKKVFIFVQII